MDIKRPPSKQPIPVNAKKVFDGKIFSVYQWEQTLFNGEKAIFEKLKRPDTVNVIAVIKDKKIVISEQQQPGIEPFLSSLGGRVDENETPLETAKRELLEEAGMEAKEFILWDAIQPVEKIDWAIYTFIAKDCIKVKEQNIEAGEKIKLNLISFEEFITISQKENYRDAEIALKVLRAINDPEKFQEMRKLFEG